jgi:hypothetical protein
VSSFQSIAFNRPKSGTEGIWQIQLAAHGNLLLRLDLFHFVAGGLTNELQGARKFRSAPGLTISPSRISRPLNKFDDLSEGAINPEMHWRKLTENLPKFERTDLSVNR